MNPTPSPNFAYLTHHDPRLAALGTQAEQHFAEDPTVTLFKLRQFGEVLAQRAAAKYGLFAGGEPQQQLIDRLHEKNVIGATQRSLFHDLRRAGNAAVHQGKGSHGDALHQRRMARELAVWFPRAYGNNKKFDPGPFVPPAEPKKAESTLHAERQRLRDDAAKRAGELEAAVRAIEEAKKAADAEAAAKLTVEQRVQKAKEEAAIIDRHLRAAGWDDDWAKQSPQRDARPVEGKTLAITDLPTFDARASAHGPAVLARHRWHLAMPQVKNGCEPRDRRVGVADQRGCA